MCCNITCWQIILLLIIPGLLLRWGKNKRENQYSHLDEEIISVLCVVVSEQVKIEQCVNDAEYDIIAIVFLFNDKSYNNQHTLWVFVSNWTNLLIRIQPCGDSFQWLAALLLSCVGPPLNICIFVWCFKHDQNISKCRVQICYYIVVETNCTIKTCSCSMNMPIIEYLWKLPLLRWQMSLTLLLYWIMYTKVCLSFDPAWKNPLMSPC